MFHESFKTRYPRNDWTTMESLWAEQGFSVWQMNWMLYMQLETAKTSNGQKNS